MSKPLKIDTDSVTTVPSKKKSAKKTTNDLRGGRIHSRGEGPGKGGRRLEGRLLRYGISAAFP
jgi:hypothetical protein